MAVRCSRAAIVGKRSNYFAPARTDHVLQAFQQGLTDLGYVDGRNIHMDYRFAEGRLDRMDELASETVQAAPDVIVAVGVAAAVPAKRATSSIPIGMAPVGDPVQDGLVPSLRVASGNITGVSLYASELNQKRIDVLKEALPGTRHIAVLINTSNTRSLRQVGRELGVRYVLEGSVRKAANRVRITGQLVDAQTGAHLWADRFEGGLEDIFDLQDNVTANVIGAISPKLEQAEIERAKQKPTENR